MVRHRFIVLGTGTGVGKTYGTARLVAGLREAGRRVLGLKPIESGIDPDHLEGTDAGLLAAASGVEPEHCYALPEPLSPHLAARRAGVSLDVSRIIEWVAERERRADAEVSFVESAGGAFSPVLPGFENAALAFALAARLPGKTELLLFGADALGVLHEVAATLRALRTLPAPEPRPPVRAVLLSEARGRDSSTGTNAEELEKVVFPFLGADAPLLGTVATLPRDGKCERFVSALLEG